MRILVGLYILGVDDILYLKIRVTNIPTIQLITLKAAVT